MTTNILTRSACVNTGLLLRGVLLWFFLICVYTLDASNVNLESNCFGFDGLGSTRFLTDVEGEVVARFFYDAFGELLYKTGEAETSYLFTGERFESSGGLYHLSRQLLVLNYYYILKKSRLSPARAKEEMSDLGVSRVVSGTVKEESHTVTGSDAYQVTLSRK